MIIDEACQALEVACWIPILKAIEARGWCWPRSFAVATYGQVDRAAPRGGKSKPKHAAKREANGAGQPGDQSKEKDFAADAVHTSSNPNDVQDDEETNDAEATTPPSPRSSPPSPSPTPPRPASVHHDRSKRPTSRANSPLRTRHQIAPLDQYRMKHLHHVLPQRRAVRGQALGAHLLCRHPSRTPRPHLPPSIGSEDDDELLAPVVLYDTSGCEFYETTPTPEEGMLLADSKSNVHEWAGRAASRRALSRRVGAGQVTILTPYSAQVALLHSTIRSHRFPTPPDERTPSMRKRSSWDDRLDAGQGEGYRHHQLGEEQRGGSGGVFGAEEEVECGDHQAKRQLWWWAMRRLWARKICRMTFCLTTWRGWRRTRSCIPLSLHFENHHVFVAVWSLHSGQPVTPSCHILEPGAI